MHILHVIDSLAVGGSERMAVDLANATVRQGHRVSVCVTRSDVTLASELDSNIKLLVLVRKKRFDWGTMWRLRQFVQQHKPDVIHAHHRSTVALLVFMKTLGWLSLRIIMHDHYGKIAMDKTVPKWLSWWGKHLIAQYVGVSNELVVWAQQAVGIPATKTHFIGNRLDLRRLQAQSEKPLAEIFPINASRLSAVVVGHIQPQKGILRLLQMLVDYDLANSFQLVLIGAERDAEYDQQCHELSRQLGLGSSIVWAGVRHDVSQILTGFDFALLPSHSESGPLVLIEYALAGLPFVTFRVGSISQQMADAGVEGFVEPDDEQAFCNEIERLLTMSSQERQKQGEQGKQIATELFDIQQAIPQWLAVYRKALS